MPAHTDTLKRTVELPYWLPKVRSAGVDPGVNFKEYVTHTSLSSVNKIAKPGFEIQKRHQQKSKIEVSVVLPKNLCIPNSLKKKKNV